MPGSPKHSAADGVHIERHSERKTLMLRRLTARESSIRILGQNIARGLTCSLRAVGAGRCPPEDCGGPFGYAELLDAITDPKHERHAELTGWIGDDFDPEAADAEALIAEARSARPPRRQKFAISSIGDSLRGLKRHSSWPGCESSSAGVHGSDVSPYSRHQWG